MHMGVWWGSLKETAKLTRRSIGRWEDNIKWILKECRYFIYHSQNRNGWGLFENTTINFYRCTVHYGIYILFIHQQFHFLLNLEKFSFTLEYT